MPGSNAGNKPNEPNGEYNKMYKYIKNKLNNNETINKNAIKREIFGNTSQYSNIQKEALYSMALENAKRALNRNTGLTKTHTGPSLLNNLEAASNNDYTKMYKHIKNKLNNNETINKNAIKRQIFSNKKNPLTREPYSNIQKETIYSKALFNAKRDSNRNKSMTENYGPSLFNNLPPQNGGKIHKGPRGGRYYISKGKKVYI